MNQHTVVASEAIFAKGNDLLTDSHFVAKAFGRTHKNVLRDIDDLLAKKPEFASAQFCAYVENRKIGVANRDIRGFQMTKDGFMLLVMGFTGEKAFDVKIAYIEAFNQMQRQIDNFNTDLMQKLLAALEAEKQSFAITSIAARIMRKRRDDKPLLQSEIQILQNQLQPLLTNLDLQAA